MFPPSTKPRNQLLSWTSSKTNRYIMWLFGVNGLFVTLYFLYTTIRNNIMTTFLCQSVWVLVSYLLPHAQQTKIQCVFWDFYFGTYMKSLINLSCSRLPALVPHMHKEALAAYDSISSWLCHVHCPPQASKPPIQAAVLKDFLSIPKWSTICS